MDHQALEQLVTNFYKDLYEFFYPFSLVNDFPEVDQEVIEYLKRIPFLTNILRTVKYMGSLKAPKPDGYRAIFFQKY